MDNKTNQELFKQALVEGINRRIDREIAAFDEEIIYSRRHIKNMARIVNGKEIKKPLNRKTIAILVAAAILLLIAGCAIIYRTEIREFVSKAYYNFVEVSFEEGDQESSIIEEIYELTYVPNGYSLEKQEINKTKVQYIFTNEDSKIIIFSQHSIDNVRFVVDSEHGDSVTIVIEEYMIYSRKTKGSYYYLWNDGKYAFQIGSNEQLSDDKLLSIIDGLKINK